MTRNNEEGKLEYLIPFLGLYAYIRDRNTPHLRGDITVIGTGSRFSAGMIGQVPLNIMESIGVYKSLEYFIQNPVQFSEIWKAIGDVGKYAFFT